MTFMSKIKIVLVFYIDLFNALVCIIDLIHINCETALSEL